MGGLTSRASAAREAPAQMELRPPCAENSSRQPAQYLSGYAYGVNPGLNGAKIRNACMPGLRFDDKLSLELTTPSTVPPGRGLSASLSRHFVPGYYRAVPPGQNHSPIEAPRIKSALMG
jgi:hypothetical protein